MGKLIKQVIKFITSMQFMLVVLLLMACFMIAGSFMSSNIFSSSCLFAFLAGLFLLSLLLCCIRRIIRIPNAIKNTENNGFSTWINAFGSPIMHIGIVIIVIGMIMGQFTAYSDTVRLTAGESYTNENLGFEVRLDSFEIIYDEDYNITDYISTVTVMEDGKEVLTIDITVNDPLKYEGVKFYQSAYGWAAGVKITETETGEELLDNVLDMDISAKGVGSVEYSMYDEESSTSIRQQFIIVPDQISEGSVNTYTPLPNNPALFFVLYYGSNISIIQDVALGESEDISGLTITFEGLDYYSGLSVNSKPELPVVFGGSIVFMVGLIIVFCMRKAL